MKKFIAIFDGYKMSGSTLNYAIQLTKTSNAHLVGIFPDESFYQSFNPYKAMTENRDYHEGSGQLNQQDQEKKEHSSAEFRNACEKEKIGFSVREDKIITIQEILEESMYADLVIISKHETFTEGVEPLPTRFIKDFLGGAQCPVLVVPDTFRPTDKTILLYDGAPSSLYAIKMYNYVLGNPGNLPIEVFTVRVKKKTDLHLPGHKLMREFIKRYFPKANFVIGKGDPEKTIVNYLRSHQKNELIVLGAYQRSEVSRWFKISMADLLMKYLDVPLFIAHNK